MDEIIVLPRQGMLWEKERKKGNMISTLTAFLRSVKPLSPITVAYEFLEEMARPLLKSVEHIIASVMFIVVVVDLFVGDMNLLGVLT